MFFHEIQTQRLLLKNIATDDRDFILKQFSDDVVNRYLFDAEPMTSLADADELIAFYNEPEPRSQHRWILVLPETGEKIGTCGLHCWNRDEGSAEVGYDMQQAHWGKGLMTEAMQAVLRFAKEEMKIKTLYIEAAVGNERSAAMARRLGFVMTPEKHERVFRGQTYLHDWYAWDAK